MEKYLVFTSCVIDKYETCFQINLELLILYLGIFTCKACYSIFFGNFAHNWGVFLFLTEIPR